jgi:hypothetical protein
MVEAEDDCRLEFIAYIVEKRVPEDKVEREKIIRRSTNYVVIGTELYQRSASNGVLMKCILRSEGLELLQEIHGGECGNHAASANLVGKAYRLGFYWPTTRADAQDLVRHCKVASSSPNSSTSWLKSWGQSHCPGPLPYGASTR